MQSSTLRKVKIRKSALMGITVLKIVMRGGKLLVLWAQIMVYGSAAVKQNF